MYHGFSPFTPCMFVALSVTGVWFLSMIGWFVCFGMVFSPVLLAVHLFVSFLLRFSWRFDLCALMPCFSVVYCCAFGLSVLHFRRAMCSGPGHLNFAWGSLDVYSVALDFCVLVFMSRLDGLDSTGVLQVSWVPEVGIVTSRHFRDLQNCGKWCLP